MIKIRFFSDYDSSEVLLKRFKENYPIGDDILNFTNEDDYDFAVVFNRPIEPIKPGTKIISIVQEPSWSEAHEYESFFTGTDYLIMHDANLFRNTYQLRPGAKLIESPSYMFYHDDMNYSFFDDTEKVKKTKKLSIIVSSQSKARGNYRKRLFLLGEILRSDLDIDIYGRGLDFIKDPRYKGSLKYKHTGLLPYEYSIAIENCNEKNYITEKFVDCVLCNTVPIYNGAPNISEVYDDHYFRKIDLDSPTIINDIKDIIAQPAPGTTVNKDIYFKDYNLYTKLKEIILEATS